MTQIDLPVLFFFAAQLPRRVSCIHPARICDQSGSQLRAACPETMGKCFLKPKIGCTSPEFFLKRAFWVDKSWMVYLMHRVRSEGIFDQVFLLICPGLQLHIHARIIR